MPQQEEIPTSDPSRAVLGRCANGKSVSFYYQGLAGELSLPRSTGDAAIDEGGIFLGL